MYYNYWKMRAINYFVMIIVVLFFFSCKDDSHEKNLEKIKKEEEQRLIQVDKSVILSINSKQYTNRDLKKFIQIQYSGISGIEQNQNMLSRIFDSFIENKTVLFSADQENIQIDQNEIQDYLKNLGSTRDRINEESLKEIIKVQKYLYFKLYNVIKVTDKEIQQYYHQNPDEFRKNPEVLLYQILVKEKEKAIKIRGILKNSPQKFEEIALKDSVSHESKNNGLMGYFEKGELPEEMEKVVFSLRINEISPVVESPYGYHIFKIKRRRRKRLLFLSKVKPQIENKLLSEKLRIAYQDFLETLNTKLNIDIKYEKLFFEYKRNTGEQKDENMQNIISYNLYDRYF